MKLVSTGLLFLAVATAMALFAEPSGMKTAKADTRVTAENAKPHYY